MPSVEGVAIGCALPLLLRVAVPLFIFMGEIPVRGGVAKRMCRALSGWLKPLPGGLLRTNFGTLTILAALLVATAAMIGTVAFATFRPQGFSQSWVAGTISAGRPGWTCCRRSLSSCGSSG